MKTTFNKVTNLIVLSFLYFLLVVRHTVKRLLFKSNKATASFVLFCAILISLSANAQTFNLALDQGSLSTVNSTGATGFCGGGNYNIGYGYTAIQGGITMTFEGQGSIASSDIFFYPANANSPSSCGAANNGSVSGASSYTWRVGFSAPVNVTSVYVNRIGGADVTNKTLEFSDGTNLLSVAGVAAATSFSNPTGGVGSNYLLNWSNVLQLDITVYENSAANFSMQMRFGDVILASTLPVTMKTFTAVQQDKGVRLNWITSSEINNKKFVIEHSRDGNTYNSIGEVESRNPNSVAELEYSYYHSSAAFGKNFYRLRQVDIDGKSTYTGIRIVTIGKNGDILSYPNPVSDRLTIYIGDQSITKGKLLVTDISGKQVYQQKITGESNTVQVSFSGWSKGLYLVNIKDNSGKSVYSEKILKN